MTTVGIMSMQRIHNYGSTLQAYSLRRMVEQEVPDADVSFVDYRPGGVLGDHQRAPESRARRVLDKVRQHSAVHAPLQDRLRFLNHKRAYGKRYFAAAGILAAPNRHLDIDCQIIGSDEVFNCVQGNPNVGYSRDLFGHDSPARRLISYAASFGNTTLDKIRVAGVESELREDLLRFDALSVRDSHSREVVRNLSGRDPLVHVDPALVHDLVNDPHVPVDRLHEQPYLVVYGYSGRFTPAENAAVRARARQTGARVLSLGGVQECSDRFVDCSPFELIAYFRHAEGVVTDTFHGTVFSIITHRPFATIVRPSSASGYGNEEKLGFLLDSFGLSSRRAGPASTIGDLLSTGLDGQNVDRVLTAERARSRAYLAEQVVAPDRREPV